VSQPGCVMLRAVISDQDAPSWVADLRAQGMTALWSDAGHCWVRFKRFGQLRYPTNDVAPITEAERRELLWRRRLAVLQYHVLAGDHPANASLYLCSDKGYSIDSLSSNNRSKVRRGLKRLEVRQISAREVIERGYDSYADTRQRHGSTMMTHPEFVANWLRQLDVPDREIWGAWSGEELAAFGTVHLCGRWAAISATVSNRAHLKDYPNHALFFRMLEHLMAKPEVETVSYGLSSVRSETARDSLHSFKVSIGLEAVPVRRHVVLHPLLRPVVNRPGLAGARLAERVAPHSRIPRAARASIEFLLDPDGEPVSLEVEEP